MPALLRFHLAAIFLIVSPLLGAEKEGFVPLFKDRTFEGWTNVNCAPSTWSFNDEGYLVCTGKPIGEIRTERMYQNFILELEWRHLVPKGNAGVFVWADDITARGVPFIRGVEIQILENSYGNTKSHTTHGDIFPIHGATMTPSNGRGGMRSFPTESLAKPSPDWNHYQIECRDGTVKLWVNGTKVNEGRDCIPRKGYLCLESEGGVVHYRNLRIKELPDTEIDPGHVAIADRGYRCLYNGVDLTGWKQTNIECKTTDPAWVSSDWFLSQVAAAGSLRTEESFADFQFVFDFRLPEDKSLLTFSLRPGRMIHPAATDLERGKVWNRVEGTVVGSEIRFTVNGESIESVETSNGGDPGPTEGPISFLGTGPVELANVYVRELP